MLKLSIGTLCHYATNTRVRKTVETAMKQHSAGNSTVDRMGSRILAEVAQVVTLHFLASIDSRLTFYDVVQRRQESKRSFGIFLYAVESREQNETVGVGEGRKEQRIVWIGRLSAARRHSAHQEIPLHNSASLLSQ